MFTLHCSVQIKTLDSSKYWPVCFSIRSDQWKKLFGQKMKLLSSFSSLLLLFFGINGCRGQDSNEVVELILEFALDQNLLDLLNFELLSEKCLNHSLVLQQRLENPIQVLTDGFWNLKSKLLYSYTHCKGIPNIAIKKLKSNLGYLTIRPWPFYN